MLENIYDSCRGNLYRFRYLNQEETSSVFLSRKGHPILGEILSRKGEADWAFYSSRINNEYDIENLPGHKDIWKILSVANISKNKNGDSEVTINYLDEAKIIGRTEEIVLHELVYELEERIQTINPILHIHDIILISDLMVKRYSLQLKRYYDHQIIFISNSKDYIFDTNSAI